MARELRSNKRAASPEAAASEPKKTRKKGNADKADANAAVDQPITAIDDDVTDAKPTKHQKKGRKAAKTDATDDEPATIQAASEPKKQPKRGKAAKVDVVDEQSNADANNDPPVTKPSKPQRKGGKAAKVEVAIEQALDESDNKPAKQQRKGAKSAKLDAAVEEPVAGNSNKLKDGKSSKQLNIPVDETCPLANYRVWIDPDGVIYDASLNQTNASNNNNKFYRIQLLESPSGDYKTWTRWGRVGERGQSAVLGGGGLADAIKNFDKKFKDKSGLSWSDRASDPKNNKYVFVERSYLPDSEPESDDDEPQAKSGAAHERRDHSPPKCTLEPPVRSLMELIFNQQYFEDVMVNMNYDTNKLPLGKLSKATISRGFQALKDLGAVLSDPSRGADVENLSNRYYSLIPHAFGRSRPPVIRTIALLKNEVELLENLSDLKAADDILKAENEGDADPVHPLDFRFNSLGMQEMTPLVQSSTEFAEVSQYLTRTCGETHYLNYEVRDIFRIERQGEFDRFQNSAYGTLAGDRRLLWHGSRTTNFGGILSQGLRIAPPEAPVNGYMFDKGVYLADMSSKSANYCASYCSGGEGLLLLCEAELGNPMQVLKDADYLAGEKAKKQGLHATWGQGLTAPKGWKDAACVNPSLAGVMMPDTTETPGLVDNDDGLYLQYNEYICYDVAQVRLRYLLRVRM